MASSNQTPDVLFSPIAANADTSDINTIPQTYDPANYGYAAQNVGFPTECRLPVLNPDGTLGQGRAPRMQDWNGIMKLVSSHNFFLQNGGSYTFNPTVSSNIGGYPKNAVLWYFPENEAPCLVYSLINDNTNNFVDDPTLIDGSHWEMLVNPSSYANIALTNSPYTTNRILEIPQNIKLELSNGTLTLKAGSKVYVPNGFESDGTTPKFDVRIIENDIINTDLSTSTEDVFFENTYNGGYLSGWSSPTVFSGPTAPDLTSSSGWGVWYDTTTNFIKESVGNYTWTTRDNYSLPFCIATSDANQKYTVNQIFNGFGYIGSTVFALPDVKVQFPDELNTDGSYKTGVYTTISVLTFQNLETTGFARVMIDCDSGTLICPDEATIGVGKRRVWNPDKNLWTLDGVKIHYAEIGRMSGETTSPYKITSAQQYAVDSVANSNASNFSQAGRSKVFEWGMPDYSAGIDYTSSWGTNVVAPSNGFVEVRSFTTNIGGTYIRINGTDHLVTGNSGSSPSIQSSLWLPVKKGDLFTGMYGAGSGRTIYFYPAIGV